jgi:hypothetical protein
MALVGGVAAVVVVQTLRIDAPMRAGSDIPLVQSRPSAPPRPSASVPVPVGDPAVERVREEVRVATVVSSAASANASTDPGAPPLIPDRILAFQELMARQSLEGGGGEVKVRRLTAAGLAVQDSEEIVRQYYVGVSACFLEIVESLAQEQGIPFASVFAEIELVTDDPGKRADLSVDLERVRKGADYCMLIAKGRAGLP